MARVVNMVSLANAGSTAREYVDMASVKANGPASYQRHDLVNFDDYRLDTRAADIMTGFADPVVRVNRIAFAPGLTDAWPWVLKAFLNYLVRIWYNHPTEKWGYAVCVHVQSVEHRISLRDWETAMTVDLPESFVELDFASSYGWDEGIWDENLWDEGTEPHGALWDEGYVWGASLGTGAYLNTTVGTSGVTTPDPGVPPNTITFIQRVSYGSIDSGQYPICLEQTEGVDPQSWNLWRTPFNGAWYMEITSDGIWANRTLGGTIGAIPTAGVVQTEAVSITFNNGSGRILMTGWTLNDATGVWTAAATGDAAATKIPFDVSTVLRAHRQFPAGSKVFWSELRTGTDPRGGSVIYRFDASEYPGAGNSYVDARGRTWTLSTAGSIVPPKRTAKWGA